MQRGVYNKRWESDWNDMKNYGPYARHLRRIVLEMISPLQFNSVLDVGCGQGALLRDIRQAFPYARLYGTDFSQSSLQLTQQTLPEVQLCAMDLTQNSFQSRFDLVVCTDVLEHIEDDIAAIKGLAELSNGYVVIATVQGRMRTHEPEAWGHVRNYAPGELAQKLSMCNLQPLRIIEWGYPFFSPLYRDFNALLGGRGTEGKYGLFRKFLASALYKLFCMNSASRGDEIFILARSICKD